MNYNKMSRIELRATWGLSTVFFLRMLGMCIVLPILTVYGMQIPKASETLIGLAIGIYGATQAIFQIPFGILSDRFGRKPLIIIGLLLFTAGSLVAAITESIWGIILGRALQGSGAISSVIMALLSDLTSEQNYTKAITFIGMGFGITFSIAIIIGPVIANILNIHALFSITALLAIIAIMITVIIVPSSSIQILNRDVVTVRSGIKTIITNKHLIKLNLSIFFLHVLLMSNFISLPTQFSLSGFPSKDHWKIYLCTIFISFVTTIPSVLYAEVNKKMKSVVISCTILMLSSEILLWHSDHVFYKLFMGLQIFFISFNIMEAILPSLINKECPAGFKGTAMGLYSTSQFLGVAIGGSVNGWLLDHFGVNHVFLFGSLLSLTWLLLTMNMREPPYLSSLRLTLSSSSINMVKLEKSLRAHQGVFDVLLLPKEKNIYIKIDNKIASRSSIEKIISDHTIPQK
ncbi:MFS transporter [Candidatus Erwinia haradaeae]|uniref:Inner membrane transport protein YajR n=1 Tax=Candidatus Erwinia haradaeae TaxID=1922217 RepID=A0A451D8L3_9GAMM|nr:MFS transporter [Candidatus Erwinia haradaeae]VFP82189.1 Inner membrane transport protein YajR [Candidatus Erwinia haradaeae]